MNRNIRPVHSMSLPNLEDDTDPRRRNTVPMSELTREELDAKLEIIELRMDARVASIESRCAGIESKIDSFIAVQKEQMKLTEHRLKTFEDDHAEYRKDFKNLKLTIVVTAISAVLAIVIGVASFNATLTSNMLGAFQAGKEATSPPPVIPVNR